MQCVWFGGGGGSGMIPATAVEREALTAYVLIRQVISAQMD